MYNVRVHKHTLQFKRPAGTSRGVLNHRDIWYIGLSNKTAPGINGWGECGPLPGLSIDDIPDFEAQVNHIAALLRDGMPIDLLPLDHLPSIRFALETAVNDLENGGRHIVFPNPFTSTGQGIPINGLVWMNNADTMLEEARQKIEQGYTCIKFKVGALDFDAECRMIEAVRKHFNAFKLEIRVDANGAFHPDQALEQLRDLSRFELHSIEQPIKAGQWEHMEELCAKTPLKIALDEELIGLDIAARGSLMLKQIKPHYLIFKPSLLGGFQRTKAWIYLCSQYNTSWWITSALESNIGLNAIAQFTANYPVQIPQGLGTGQLYTNNIQSPLVISNGHLWYQPHISWNSIPENNR